MGVRVQELLERKQVLLCDHENIIGNVEILQPPRSGMRSEFKSVTK